MTKALYYLVVLLLVGIGATLKFANKHEAMPIGCDEFGYLNLAKTFDEGHLAERPYLEGLLANLRAEGITETELAWMVTPHAYHIIPGSYLVINQYPPGTSFLLSLIPIEWRNLLFPLLVMILLIGITSLIPTNYSKTSWSYFDLTFPVLLFIITVSAPFTTELARVNSLAFTFGLLIAGGMSLKDRPLLAGFLIALTVNFRIVNILMVIPVVLFLPFVSIHTKKWLKQNLILLIKFSSLVISAVVPVLIYNYQLLGNPFASTYSVIDTAVNQGGDFIKNLEYYFSLNNYWLTVHLTSLVILLVLSFKAKLKGVDLLKVISFPILNYLFLGWHAVTMDYYPYASAMVFIGMILSIFADINIREKFRFIAPVMGIGIAAVIFTTGFNRYRKKEHLTFLEARDKYAVLCNYDIVWCDLFSGTTEYVCGNYGFRFATSTPRARKITMEYLHSKNYNQVIILHDIPLASDQIKKEVENTGLVLTIVNDKALGKLIIIPGSTSKNKILN